MHEPATPPTPTIPVPVRPDGQILVSGDAPQEQQSSKGGFLTTLPMLLAILAIFYFLLIRPQQKEQKVHRELLASIKKGDLVVTASGLHGRVWSVSEAEVVIEVAEKVRVTFDRASIKRKSGEKPETEKKG